MTLQHKPVPHRVFKSWRRWLIGAIALSTVGFSLYIAMLYNQLEQVFTQQDQFIPTRIYSDVTRIAPAALRSRVEERLRALGYTPEVVADGTTLKFNLHGADYPAYLVPEGHPVVESQGPREAALEFDGKSTDSRLHSLRFNGVEVSDLYLEPEIIATLSRDRDNPESPDGSTQAVGAPSIRHWVKLQDVPPQIWKAIIAVEDQHFLEHKGLDPRGFARALWVDIKSLRFAQGGSTITQQLVKLLMARRTRNLRKKINEIFLTLILEVKYEKEQILERYLNQVNLGQIGSLEVLGVGEGAKHFFGKRLEDLNLGEIALMAALIRSPFYYSPYRHRDRAFERQKLVLRKMVETGQIAEEEMQQALKLPIRLAPPPTVANKAPYFSDFVKAELIRMLKDKMTEQEIFSRGFKVYTTLDAQMNVIAQRSVAQGVDSLEKRVKLQPGWRLEGALAAVDHSTGYIRALVGGKNYAQSNFNRILNMRRQVGSTFKPFVYLGAFVKGQDRQGVPYSGGYPMEDATWTLTYDRGKQTWTPRNYEKEFRGWIPLRTALAHSVNTVAAKLGVEVGINSVAETAKAAGIETDLPRVPSLSLGVAELSPVELLRAYATLANHGQQDELTVVRGITHDNGQAFARFVFHPRPVLDPGPVDLLTDMLQTVFVDGTASMASKLGLDRPAAGKTGTTSSYRDAWFAGYTPELTAVAWVGLDVSPEDGSPKLTGAGAALPIWVSFIKDALAGAPPAPFAVSDHIESRRLNKQTGRPATADCPDSSVIVEKTLRSQSQGQESCEILWPESKNKMELE